jgi:putative DNA primase/helicase
MIPNELKENGLFCLWKDDKVPYTIYGTKARPNDARCFSSYAKVIEAYKQGGYSGIGILLANGYDAIDLDDCPMTDSRALDALTLKTYGEKSPSGKGLHFIFKNVQPFDKNVYYIKNSKAGMEIYLSSMTPRFITITGQNVNDFGVADSPDLAPLLQKYMKRESTVSVDADAEHIGAKTDISEALAHDRKLATLWNSEAPGSGADESERDMSLCCKLAYWLGGDKEAVDAAFRSSPYYKSKDEKHTAKWEVREDYREMVLERARQIVMPAIKENEEFERGREEHLEKKEPRPASAEYAKDYTLDDTGNAQRFIDMFGEDVRYNTDNMCWMIFKDGIWQTDMSGEIREFVNDMTDQMMAQSASWPAQAREAYSKNINYLRSHRGKDNCLSEAQHLRAIANEAFDRDGWTINTRSGLIDLRTGEMRSASREDYLSKTTGCECDIEHEPVEFLKYLKDILRNHPEIYDYVHRLFGYAITNSLREQQMYFLYGDGNDGKSLLLEVLSDVLGDYAWTAKNTLLTEQINQNKSLTQIALMKGRRFISIEELKPEDRLDESLVKEFTSGLGQITGKFLYANEFNFSFYGKLFMATNYKPNIRGTDKGIWRRIVLIPFDRSLKDEEVNKDLKDILLKEKPQILGWLVKGCLEYQTEGLVMPSCIKEQTSEYRTEQDKVASWIKDRCLTDNPASISSASDLFQDFLSWCKKNNEYPMSQTMFGRSMSKKFQKHNVGRGIAYYGIEIDPAQLNIGKARLAAEYDRVEVDKDI